MTDQSELDRKYFIDQDKYNCPFCNRKSVVFSVCDRSMFNWSDERTVYIYLVKCHGCEKISFHLSDYYFGPGSINFVFYSAPLDASGEKVVDYKPQDLDKYFFHHQPSTFFAVNTLIPLRIRELIAEADGCREMNYLVGASGALRKAIYELLLHQKAEGKEYQDKIKWLKKKYPNIFEEYFDALANIQDMASDNLHEKEGTWNPWKRDDFDYLLETVKATLDEIYVKPEERKSILSKITRLKSKSVIRKPSK